MVECWCSGRNDNSNDSWHSENVWCMWEEMLKKVI